MQYVNNYDDRFPTEKIFNVGGTGDNNKSYWFTRIAQELGYDIPWGVANAPGPTPQIFMCPSQNDNDSGVTALQNTTLYNRICYIDGFKEIGYISNGDVISKKLSRIRRSSQVVITGELNQAAANFDECYFLWNSENLDQRLKLDRHSNGCNFLFCDGHAGWKKITRGSDVASMFVP
jgi:prepilin-type processing-associated H-X9-DG protein